jgi:hypothetical protein
LFVETSALGRSVIDVDKISLPVCAFGAGLAHAVALALVLPIAITLPAAGQSMTAGWSPSTSRSWQPSPRRLA